MNSHPITFNQSIVALQVLIFEMNWPTFKWIKSIYFRTSQSTITLQLEYQQKPDETEVTACSKMLEEIYEAAFSSNGADRLKLAIAYANSWPSDNSSKKLFDDQIFRQIAKDVAPWRLESGR